MQPLVSATLIHSTSSPSKALTGTSLTWRCFPLKTTISCSSVTYSSRYIFFPSPTRAISGLYPISEIILIDHSRITYIREHFYSPLRSKSKQNRPSSVPMTRRSGSIIVPDITFLISARVLSSNSLTRNIWNRKISKWYRKIVKIEDYSEIRYYVSLHL